MKILIVIDMQNDFIDGSLGTKEAMQIVAAVQKKIEAGRKAGDTIIFTRDTHGADYLSTQEGSRLPVTHCIRGTHGWQISDALDTDGCTIIDKPSFGSIALADAVAALPNVEGIELCGLCTDICVISNALILKARLPQIPVCVDATCCAGVTPESHENALKAMAMCQVEIR